jgi:hypothetical protein
MTAMKMIHTIRKIPLKDASVVFLNAAQKRSLSTSMNLADFANFHIPSNLIAQSPATPRDSSKLMVVRRDTGTPEHHYFREVPLGLGLVSANPNPDTIH